MTDEITVTYTTKVTREGDKWGTRDWAPRTLDAWRWIAENQENYPSARALAAAMVAHIEAHQPWMDAKPGDVLDVKIGGQWFRGVVGDFRAVELLDAEGVHVQSLALGDREDTAPIEDSRLLELPKPGECRE